MPEAIRLSADAIDLTPRVLRTATVVASPATTAETTVASLTISRDLSFTLGVVLFGYAAYTVGTAGVSVVVRIRRTNTTGTIIKASGAATRVAANLEADSIVGVDTGPTLPGQVYVLTMTVASASAESTVSAVELVAVVV